MNNINRINRINQQELESNVKDSASWHMDYKDTNYIYIGGINHKLQLKDLLVIFSQYGIPTHVKLVKDKENPELNKGFGYLKYRDFKSCVLAVDNFNGITVYDKTIRVDHCWFELRDDEHEEDYLINYEELVPKFKQLEDGKRGSHNNNPEKKMIENSAKEDNKITTEGDEFKDPMQDFKASVEEDEFKDPMESFIKRPRKEDGESRSHKRRHHGHSHRHHHKSGHSRRKENHNEKDTKEQT